ncbi:hypothetical protein Tsubulata_007316, partial [Turnera subulata]
MPSPTRSMQISILGSAQGLCLAPEQSRCSTLHTSSLEHHVVPLQIHSIGCCRSQSLLQLSPDR